MPAFHWYKRLGVKTPIKGFETTGSKGWYSFFNLTWKMGSGTYVCEVTNSNGYNMSEMIVTVGAKPHHTTGVNVNHIVIIGLSIGLAFLICLLIAIRIRR